MRKKYLIGLLLGVIAIIFFILAITQKQTFYLACGTCFMIFAFAVNLKNKRNK